MRSASHLRLPSWRELPGFSRHSLVLRDAPARATSFGAKASRLAIGSLMIGVAVNLLRAAELGLAPYDVLAGGVAHTLGLSLGQAAWVVAGLLFATATVLGHRPTIWSVAFVVANGTAIDATDQLIAAPTSLAARILLLLSAIAVMAFGINLVLHAGVTGGPFELLIRAGQDRGRDPVVIRYCLDIGVLSVGIIIGGPFGPGTLVFAATMGAVFAQMQQLLADHRAGRTARLQASRSATTG